MTGIRRSESLPGKGKKAADIGLEPVILALYHHALLGAIAETVPDDNVHVDARTVPVRTSDVKLARSFGKMLLQKTTFHALLYYVFLPASDALFAGPNPPADIV